MSSGLMSFSALPKSKLVLLLENGAPPRLAFDTGTPSTMNNGWLLPVIEF